MTKTYSLSTVRRVFTSVIVVSLTVATIGAVSTQAKAGQAFKYSIALIGDMPYDAKGVAQVPNVINSINSSKVELVSFDGDTMSGKGVSIKDVGLPVVMPKREGTWTPLNGGVSRSNNDKPEKPPVKIRGTGAATKGLMARGGMA